MGRDVTLVRLLDLVRGEARLSLNAAHNQQTRDHHVQLIQRTQEWLWSDFNWPHLRTWKYLPLVAGQRYYAPPTDFKIDRIQQIEVKYGDVYECLHVGIGPQHLAEWDSELDERSWPVERWQIGRNEATGDEERIEVWPIPADSGDATTREGYLRITGIRNLRDLIDDDDRCDLDDQLITKFAAAELLAASGAKDAQLKLDQANKLYAKLRGQLMPRQSFRMYGNGAPRTDKGLRGPPRVHYRTIT